MRFFRFLALLAALAGAMPAARAQTTGDRVIGADSSTTTLGAAGVFTGTSFTTSGAAALCVGVYADVASASGGLSIQQSKDGTNWDLADTFTVSAATAYATTVAVVQPYARVVYTNGGTLQATFRLTTTLRYSGPQLPRTLTQAGSLPVELTAGSATIGTVNQGTAGSATSAWPVTVTGALPAGTNLLGKVGTDQTTHGTTDKVAADLYVGGTLASGTNAVPVTVTGALPTGTNSLGTVGLNTGSNIVGRVGIDQTTPGTTDSVSVATAQGAGANIGLTTDAAVGDATGTLIAHERQTAKILTANLPAPGQGAMAASVPVVIASNQSAVNVGIQVGAAAVSGTNAVPVTVTGALPTGTNSIGTVVLGAGTAIAGKVGIDQTTPGTTDSVSVSTAQGQGAQVGLTTDAAVLDANGTLNAHTRGVVKQLAGGLPAALSSGGGVKVGVVDALPAGTNLMGKVGIDQTTPGTTNGVYVNTIAAGTNIIGKITTDQTTHGTTDKVAADVYVNGTLASATNALPVTVTGALPAGSNSIGTVVLGAGSAAIGSVTQGMAAADTAPWPVKMVEPTVATYRAAFSVVVTGTGDFIEFLGNGTTVSRILSVTIVKPSAAVGIKITKRSANDTAGVSTNLTLVPLDSANAASSATIKAYTTAPTAGTSVGDIFPNMSVATTDQFTLTFGDTIGQPVVIRNNQSLCLNTDASSSTTIMGVITWQER